MDAKKLRRKLIGLCFALFAIWVVTTFSQIVLWYAKVRARVWSLLQDVIRCLCHACLFFCTLNSGDLHQDICCADFFF